MASYLKQNELKLQIENLNVQLNQKVIFDIFTQF